MSYILGIGQGHDASACLLKDGKIVAAAEEERFTRVKHSINKASPSLASKFCIDYAGIKPSDIDYVAVDMNHPISYYVPQMKKVLHPYYFNTKSFVRRSMQLAYNTFMSDIMKKPYRLGDLGQQREKFKFIPHHTAHAATAFYCSGFKKADVLVTDGIGEVDCTSFWRGDGTELVKEHSVTYPHSLGFFYGAFTQFLAYHFASGEGQVMGLAPYGKYRKDYYDKMANILQTTKDGYRMNPKYYDATTVHAVSFEKMEKDFGPRARMLTELDTRLSEKKKQHYRDIAFALQKRLEDVVLNLLDVYGVGKTLCVAGGVALNCKMNGVLWDSGRLKNFFIQPAAGDNGGSFGAALALADELGDKVNHKMNHAYWGPEFSNAEIKKSLSIAKLKAEYHKDIAGVAAELLVKNKIIGWYQGRMEFGPRALGNRSILMSPMKQENKDIINARVKFREAFRPFCPSLVASAAKKYFENAYEAPFMIHAFHTKPGVEKEIPSVVHVDNTVRPQLVERKVNKKYYDVINAFGKETGTPVLMNTSFNVKGEPIVNTPKDAISCFFNTGMDYLVLGNYIIKK